MTVRALTSDDLDWAVGRLAERRALLVPEAPVFWRPAESAARAHRSHLEHLITAAGARGYRTDESVLIAARLGGVSWLVDDLYVPGDRWSDGEGRALWDAIAADCPGQAVRLVCPTYERRRSEFARDLGLELVESWWLLELAGCGGGEGGVDVDLPEATARTVDAPPVYSPGGPVLFLPSVEVASTALPAALERAPGLGCAALVVSHRPGDAVLAEALREASFRRHCDYYAGTL